MVFAAVDKPPAITEEFPDPGDDPDAAEAAAAADSAADVEN